MPILSGRFHTNILAVVIFEPLGKLTQVFGVGGKSLVLVSCKAFIVGRSDTSNDKSFVNVNATADWIDYFEQSFTSLKDFIGDKALTGRSSLNETCLTNFSLRALWRHLFVLERATGTYCHAVGITRVHSPPRAV